LDRTGQILDGKYRVGRLLGEGGMGAVYVAEHLHIGKKLAIKFLHPQFANDAEVVRRFHQEARAAAAVGHKGIIDIHDIGQAVDGSPYLVMELLSGESLHATLDREHRLSVGFAASVAINVLSALAAAHRRGIVHRDIKPDNIFLEQTLASMPSVKLLDFGISKMSELGSTYATRTGMAMGTPHYMAPEQARGESGLDQRVDIWAMGVILYESLTGKLPFDAPNYNAMIVKVLTEAPAPPRQIRPEVPEPLEAVILRALSRDRNARYPRCEALIESLLPFAEDGPSATQDTGVVASTAPAPSIQPAVAPSIATPKAWEKYSSVALPPSRGRQLVVTGLIVAGIAVGGLVIWSVQDTGPEIRPPIYASNSPLSSPAAAPQPAPAVASVPAIPQAVTIAVLGAPSEARYYLDGALTQVPIRLAPRNMMVPLRVEANGYETFSQMILPTHDQTITVSLRATPPVAALKRGLPPPRATSRERPAPSPSSEAAPDRASPPGPPTRRSHTQRDTSEFGP
jgi:serine/threonine-protein kinase